MSEIRIKFDSVAGYKVYFKGWNEDVEYTPLDFEWAVSPFVNYGILNHAFAKVAIL